VLAVASRQHKLFPKSATLKLVFVGARYVHYYDIFVRHAFGNFRDVLREVVSSVWGMDSYGLTCTSEA